MLATNMCSNFGGFRCGPPIELIRMDTLPDLCQNQSSFQNLSVTILELESGAVEVNCCQFLLGP